MGRGTRALGAVAVTVSVTVAGTVAGTGGAAAAAPSATAAPPATADAGLVAAASRDLGVPAGQVHARFARDAAAGRRIAALRERLGDRFAGGWVTGDSDLPVIAVTGADAAAAVREGGARPLVVARSERALAAAKARLDAAAGQAPAGVHGWYVDVAANRVVVTAADPATAAGFVAAAGAEATVVPSTDAPVLHHDVRGGDPYYPNDHSGHCSIGFAVQGGFVTAGHCGAAGDFTTGFNRVQQGTFEGSSFPGNDYAWVRTNVDWTLQGVVYDYADSTVPVAGATPAPVGAAVCRSGFTSGWKCGLVEALDQTVNYFEGTVRGLTRTSACSRAGDSGGAFIAGDQAQGVLSGGAGDCASGTTGRSYFQPLPEILSVYGLTLLTSTGGGGGIACDGYPNSYGGSLSGNGASQIQPSGGYYRRTTGGGHRACLAGPADPAVDFDLELQRWSGRSWATVARADSATSAETLTYSGGAGYYRWRVLSAAGSGAYTLATD